ncbi:hypothetical protein Q7P36_008805 [Cladosporium allicinum]
MSVLRCLSSRFIDETVLPHQHKIFATPSTESVPATTIIDTRAPRSTVIMAIPKQEVPARSTAYNSTSAPLEYRNQPSTEEDAAPVQEKISARVTQGGQPTSTSLQSGIHVPVQDNHAPKPEDITRLSVEMTPMRPLAKPSLSNTKKTTTSGESCSPEVSPEVAPLNQPVASSAQSSTLQSATPERRDSTKTTAEVPPVSAPIEHGTRRSTPRNVAPNLEDFFEKYKSMIEPSNFDEFRSTLGRERDFGGPY